MVCRSITCGSSIPSIPPSEASTGNSYLTSMPTKHSFKHGTKTRTALVFGVATRCKFPRGEREPTRPLHQAVHVQGAATTVAAAQYAIESGGGI